MDWVEVEAGVGARVVGAAVAVDSDSDLGSVPVPVGGLALVEECFALMKWSSSRKQLLQIRQSERNFGRRR